MAADGSRFALAWGETDEPESDGDRIVFQVFDSTGSPLMEPIPVTEGTESRCFLPAVGMNGEGSHVIAWQCEDLDGDSWGVFARLFDEVGAPRGPEFQVNVFTDSNQEHVSTAMSADGRFVVSWESEGQDGDGDGIFAQRFDATGTPLGTLPW